MQSVGTSATAPGCGQEKGTIVRFISGQTGIVAKWLWFEIQSCDSSQFSSQFDRRKTHKMFWFCSAQNSLRNTDRKQYCSQYIPFSFWI